MHVTPWAQKDIMEYTHFTKETTVKQDNNYMSTTHIQKPICTSIILNVTNEQYEDITPLD